MVAWKCMLLPIIRLLLFYHKRFLSDQLSQLLPTAASYFDPCVGLVLVCYQSLVLLKRALLDMIPENNKNMTKSEQQTAQDRSKKPSKKYQKQHQAIPISKQNLTGAQCTFLKKQSLIQSSIQGILQYGIKKLFDS